MDDVRSEIKHVKAEYSNWGASEEQITEEERLLRLTCFRVMKWCCQDCLFGKNKLVSQARKDEILAELDPDKRGHEDEGRHDEANKTFFVCHLASVKNQVVCCRAFYDRYKDRSPELILVQLLAQSDPNALRFVQPDEFA